MCISVDGKECVTTQAPGGELEVMSRNAVYVENCSATAKTEQALSTNHPQQEPVVARNSWRELLEIVDTYLTRHGVNG
jgi:hypothetical protein